MRLLPLLNFIPVLYRKNQGQTTIQAWKFRAVFTPVSPASLPQIPAPFLSCPTFLVGDGHREAVSPAFLLNQTLGHST